MLSPPKKRELELTAFKTVASDIESQNVTCGIIRLEKTADKEAADRELMITYIPSLLFRAQESSRCLYSGGHGKSPR